MHTCQQNICISKKNLRKESMKLTVINIRIDPRMKQAIEKVAKKEFSSLSGIIKKASQEYLEKQGVDWEKEKVPPKGKK